MTQAASDESRARNLEGQRLGPYQLGARIGAGGMGEVYKANDTRLERTVAVKVLTAQIAEDPQSRERFVARQPVVVTNFASSLKR